MDGVLANWNKAFREVLIQETGKDLAGPGSENPPVWHWPAHYGYTPEEEKKAYAAAAASEVFWLNLEPLPAAGFFLERIQADESDDLYFITTRPGTYPKMQTEAWLEFQGVQNPTVLLGMSPKSKGLLAAGLGLTHFIDDRDKNCAAVRELSPETQVFLLDRNYNRAEQNNLLAAGVVVINSIMEFAHAIGV